MSLRKSEFILVTAFGPFGGRTVNASTMVLAELRKNFPEIRTRKLPVDSVLAPKRLKEAIRKVKPAALVMLGEAGESNSIRLETTAWNMKCFPIPDIAGRKPTGVPVRHNRPETFQSTLPLEEIQRRLLEKDIPGCVSTDAGRYLCNQVFFTALDYFDHFAMKMPAGFVHLPLESELPTAVAINGVSTILETLLSTRSRRDEITF